MISISLTGYLQLLNVPIDNPLKDDLRKNMLDIALNKKKAAQKFP